MMAYRPVLKQNANEGCNSCASLAGLVLFFIACFILLVIAPLSITPVRHCVKWSQGHTAGGLGLLQRVNAEC